MRRRLALIATAVAVTSVAACGDDDGGGSGRLSDALDAVSVGPSTERYFAWSDVAAIRAVATDDGLTRRWAIPLAAGAPQLVQGFVTLEASIGLDTIGADQVTTIGLGTEGSASRVDGVDAARVQTATTKLGAEATSAGGRDVLRLPSDGDSEALAPLTPNTLLLADDETVAVATSERALADVLGDGQDDLGARDEYAAGAGCLGDVVSASLLPASGARTDIVQLVAVGVRGGEDPREVLCLVGDEAQAQAGEEALRAHLDGDAVSAVTRRPLADELAGVEIDSGEANGRSYARAVITPQPDGPLGFVNQLLVKGELARW